MDIRSRLEFIKATIKFFGSRSDDSSLVFSLFISILFSHLYWFNISHDPNWIGALGADLTVYSLVRGFSTYIYPAFKEDVKPKAIKQGDLWSKLPEIAGSFATLISEKEAKEINDKQDAYACEKYTKVVLMQWLAIVGTIVWAYAFLLHS